MIFLWDWKKGGFDGTKPIPRSVAGWLPKSRRQECRRCGPEARSTGQLKSSQRSKKMSCRDTGFDLTKRSQFGWDNRRLIRFHDSGPERWSLEFEIGSG